MIDTQIEHLIGLVAVVAIAVGAVLLLLRLDGRRTPHSGPLLPGYPVALFPAQELTRNGPLAALAATQHRLIALYLQMPAQSETAVWLCAFLSELRAIMNTAYQVAVITLIYGTPPQLQQLSREVTQLETQVIEHVTRNLLTSAGDIQNELLEGRLAALHMHTHELAQLVA